MQALEKKRLEVLLTLTGYVASGSAAAFVPTPCAETPKQLTLTAADILMYASIWKTYFEDDLAHKELLTVLSDLGIVAVAAAGTAYVATRSTTAVVKELTAWTGIPAWGASAAIAGTLTGVFGATWILYCDYLYQKTTQVPLAAAIGTVRPGGNQ